MGRSSTEKSCMWVELRNEWNVRENLNAGLTRSNRTASSATRYGCVQNQTSLLNLRDFLFHADYF